MYRRALDYCVGRGPVTTDAFDRFSAVIAFKEEQSSIVRFFLDPFPVGYGTPCEERRPRAFRFPCGTVRTSGTSCLTARFLRESYDVGQESLSIPTAHAILADFTPFFFMGLFALFLIYWRSTTLLFLHFLNRLFLGGRKGPWLA